MTSLARGFLKHYCYSQLLINKFKPCQGVRSCVRSSICINCAFSPRNSRDFNFLKNNYLHSFSIRLYWSNKLKTFSTISPVRIGNFNFFKYILVRYCLETLPMVLSDCSMLQNCDSSLNMYLLGDIIGLVSYTCLYLLLTVFIKSLMI